MDDKITTYKANTDVTSYQTPTTMMDEAKQGRVVLVVGSEFGCGKTVFMCGVAGALRELGFRTRVFKPLIIGGRKQSEDEVSFLATVGQTPVNYPVTFLEGPLSIKETNWQNSVLMTRSPDQLTFVEMPGGAASPVCFEENSVGTMTNTWRDSADLANEFIQPCIVVAKHQIDAIERLVMTCAYLQHKGLVVIATATVETEPNGGAELEKRRTRADFSIGLNSKTGVPFLGCIKNSSSVSVPRVTQGNLIKQTESGLDLLPLLKAINLTMPTG